MENQRERNTIITVAIILVVLLHLAGAVAALGEENHDFAKPFLVGSALVFAPMAFDSPQIPWGHAIELEGFTYGGTDLGFRFLPEEIKWASPFIMAGLVLAYRIPQLGRGEDDLILRKMGMDGLGIVGRVVIEL